MARRSTSKSKPASRALHRANHSVDCRMPRAWPQLVSILWAGGLNRLPPAKARGFVRPRKAAQQWRCRWNPHRQLHNRMTWLDTHKIFCRRTTNSRYRIQSTLLTGLEEVSIHNSAFQETFMITGPPWVVWLSIIPWLRP